MREKNVFDDNKTCLSLTVFRAKPLDKASQVLNLQALGLPIDYRMDRNHNVTCTVVQWTTACK
jgi:hypothetical protein